MKKVAAVTEDAPGVAHWEPAWIHIKPSDDAFNVAFQEWKGNDTKDTRDSLRVASDAYVEAWREAAHMYKEK